MPFNKKSMNKEKKQLLALCRRTVTHAHPHVLHSHHLLSSSLSLIILFYLDGSTYHVFTNGCEYVVYVCMLLCTLKRLFCMFDKTHEKIGVKQIDRQAEGVEEKSDIVLRIVFLD